MGFDLDKVIAAADIEMARRPWSLQVKIGERLHTVRPLAEEDLKRLAGLKAADGDEAKAFWAGLFVGEAPDCEALSAEQFNAFVVVAGSYLQERLRLRRKIINREVKLQHLGQLAMERGE